MVIRALKQEFQGLEATQIHDENSLSLSLAEDPFDLIITDFQLNWSTGLQLLARFRKHSPNAPIIMYTGTGNELVAVEAMKSGVEDYIVKSVSNIKYLVSATRACLEKKHERMRGRLPEGRLEMMVSHLNIGAFRPTLAGVLLSANAVFLEMLGFNSIEEACLLAFRNPKDGFHDLESVLREILGGSARGKSEIRITRTCGKKVWISVSLIISSQFPQEVEGMVEDISARKNDEQLDTEKQDSLRQGEHLDSIAQLAGGVAHDFNNMLTTINGLSELLLEKVESSELRQDIIEIHKAGSQAAKLTSDLLSFGRRQMLEKRVVDLNKLICNHEDLIREKIAESWIYESNLCADPLLVKVDQGHMKRVILNLLNNAIEALGHSDQGRITIVTGRADLKGKSEAAGFQKGFSGPQDAIIPGRYVFLSITDSGIGMEPSTLARIFEPFFTTKVRKGPGMSLASVYGIVRQSEGYVLVKSAPMKGSTFRVLLPAVS